MRSLHFFVGLVNSLFSMNKVDVCKCSDIFTPHGCCYAPLIQHFSMEHGHRPEIRRPRQTRGGARLGQRGCPTPTLLWKPPGTLFLRLIWRSFRPSGPWCFGVARGTFWKPAAAVALFLTRSSTVTTTTNSGTKTGRKLLFF